jgi:outer membrane protein OmpA-like peptidoglycan-associated protein
MGYCRRRVELPAGVEPSSHRSDRGASNVWLVIATLVVLLAVGVVGALFLEKIENIEDGVAGIDDRVMQIDGRVDEAVDLASRAAQASEEALLEARSAEESAIEAARGRTVADEARAQAEVDLAEALAVAEASREEVALARQESERIRSERQAELDRLQATLNTMVETRRTALGLVMDLGADAIEFDFDRADLGSSERELLSRIAGVLLTSTGYTIYIYGHTDDVGTIEYNQRLSERRAEAVRDYLVQSGIDFEIITTRGYGQTSPRLEGSSPAVRARNRRVEIGIVDVTLDYQGEVPND